MKRIQILIMGLVISILLCSCVTSNNTVGTNDEKDSYVYGEDKKVSEDLEVLGLIDNYIEVQDKIDKINLTEYLPSENMRLVYESGFQEGKSLQSYIDVTPVNNVVMYYGEVGLDVIANLDNPKYRYMTEGTFAYAEEKNCLEDAHRNAEGSFLTRYLYQIGEREEMDNGVVMEDLPFLFSVKCEAGEFKDCVAVVSSELYRGKEVYSISYYAKGIGKVLGTSNNNEDGVFNVVEYLKSITYYNGIGNNSDVNYDWWEGKEYISNRNGKKFYGQRNTSDGKVYFCFANCYVPVDDSNVTVESDNNNSKYIKYSFRTKMRDYYNQMIYDEYYIIYDVDNDMITAYNASDTYNNTFYFGQYRRQDEYENQQGENSYLDEDEIIDSSLFEGQRFECFETICGEDVTLTVRLFYSDDSDEPSAYKGEMDNGLEFWFESCETYDDKERYKIDCLDGSNAFLTYYPSRGEIELTAEEGDEYENMYAYCGTYIALPDEVEE